MRAAPFEWTPARLEVLETLYRVAGQRSATVAGVLGCSVKSVVRKAGELGWGAERRVARRAARVKPFYGKERTARAAAVSRSDAELIAEAIAAGRVRTVAAGTAAGITAWERAMGRTAPPPGAEFNAYRIAPTKKADQAARRAA